MILEKNTLISIIIPVYNGANYMREAIDSALAQTYKNIEVIVVNDGSIDSTDEIARSYGDKIRYFKKENGGVSSALNLALREMKGEFFSWLSHDDIYYPNKVEKQINFLSELKEKNVILYSDCELIDYKSKFINNMIFDHSMLFLKPQYALLRGSINGCTLLIPRKAFDEHGFFDEKLKCTQDYAKWFEMMKSYDFLHMAEILVKHRIHDLQDTNTSPFFLKEGNDLWINMMINLPIDDKIRLEGSEFRFYREMNEFLKKTCYAEALKFSEKLMLEKSNKAQRIMINICKFIRSRAVIDFIKKIENPKDSLIRFKKKYIKKVFIKLK